MSSVILAASPADAAGLTISIDLPSLGFTGAAFSLPLERFFLARILALVVLGFSSGILVHPLSA
jgi:hypothetical protein